MTHKTFVVDGLYQDKIKIVWVHFLFLSKLELQAVEDEIEKQALYIAEDKPLAALQWYDNIQEKIQTLEASPNRCPQAPESQYFDFEIRHLLIGNYRVLFRIEKDTVITLHFKNVKQNKPEQKW